MSIVHWHANKCCQSLISMNVYDAIYNLAPSDSDSPESLQNLNNKILFTFPWLSEPYSFLHTAYISTFSIVSNSLFSAGNCVERVREKQRRIYLSKMVFYIITWVDKIFSQRELRPSTWRRYWHKPVSSFNVKCSFPSQQSELSGISFYFHRKHFLRQSMQRW